MMSKFLVFDTILALAVTVTGLLLLSVLVYFAIRFFAYRRSFPLPHRYDFLWAVNTLLVIFSACLNQPPLDEILSQTFKDSTFFTTFLLSSYLLIFVVDQFLVEYFLVSMLKVYIAPPLRKVIVLAIFAVAVLVGMQQIFGITAWKVYAPTGILLPAIGFALKDSFQTFFSGVALSRIVRIGDWVRSGDKEGEVIDINWARTVLRAWDGAHHFIPNSELQKGVFQSFSYNEGTNRCQVQVGVSYLAPPQKVKSVLLECVQNVDGILTDPSPETLLLNYADSSVQYALTFWVKDYSRWREMRSEVSTRIWYAFKREGIEIPFPIRTLQLARRDKAESRPIQPEAMLAQIDLFKMLSQQDKQLLLGRLQRESYLKGEIVVREGDAGSSFYILFKGDLEVLRRGKNGKQIFLGGLKSGQFFGELSLLTGEPRSATIRALADSELLRLEKMDFSKILEQHPDLAESLAEIVTSRQSSILEITESMEQEKAVSQQKSSLSRKIRDFFNLKAEV